MMNKKVKVVQLLTTMADGGAETLVKDYTLLCDRDKVDMQIISWSEPLGSANERILAQNGIKVTYLGESPKKKTVLGKIARRINKYIRFRRLIISENIDVIHIHLRIGIYMKVLPKSCLKRIKLFYTLHNEPEKFFDANGKGRNHSEYKEAKRLIEKYGMHVITLHDKMNKQVRELFKTDRVTTINNGINLQRFDASLYDREAIREELGIPKENYVIGHVGSFTGQKNHKYLLDIYEEYLKKDSNAKLLLIGRGVLKDIVKADIESRGLADKVIILKGRDDIPQLMTAMDVFVMPSKWEGFPITLIEAQSIGLSCVISDVINTEVVLTDRIRRVSLEAGTRAWVDAIDGKVPVAEKAGELNDYSILNSIRRLEEMYCS